MRSQVGARKARKEPGRSQKSQEGARKELGNASALGAGSNQEVARKVRKLRWNFKQLGK